MILTTKTGKIVLCRSRLEKGCPLRDHLKEMKKNPIWPFVGPLCVLMVSNPVFAVKINRNSDLRAIVIQQQAQLAKQAREMSVLNSRLNQVVILLHNAQQRGRIPTQQAKPVNTAQKRVTPVQTKVTSKPPATPKLAPPLMDRINAYLKHQFPFEISGRLMYDYANYWNATAPLGSGTKLRRARLAIKGNVTPNWAYKLSLDFAENAVSVKDAFIRYLGFKPYYLTVGQFKEPFSLEELTSSKYITFMERGLPNALVPGRRIGIGLNTYGDFSRTNKYTAAIGLFGKKVGTPVTVNNEGYGVTGRMTDAYVPSKNVVVTGGVSAGYRKPDGSQQVEFSSLPEADVNDTKLIDTGIINNVNHMLLYGVEAAAEYHSLSAQTEFIQTYLTRGAGNSNVSFYGWYAYVSWFMTGESRPYEEDDGTFGRVKPLHSYGAWELAVRYSGLSLNSNNISGGDEHNITLGLNWYVNPYVRFMANYVKAYTKKSGVSDNPNVFELRAQIDF